jgi:hypothetical protein
MTLDPHTAFRLRKITAALGTLLLTLPILAAAEGPGITLGAGMQTGFVHTTAKGSGKDADSFKLDSLRLYINGTVMDKVNMTVNTEYTSDNNVEVMDAIARFEFSPAFNIWAGRFLPPADRANLYGSYYANEWNPYADGVADFYPSVAVGRDNGVAYWGQFGIFKFSLGAFDGPSLHTAVKRPDNVLGAARVQVDFWDPEPGYYQNATYYGEKNVLALGIAGQTQDSTNSYSIDGLLERKLGNLGTVTIETEYESDEGLIFKSDGWYGLGSYLFPQVVGVGRFQVLGKYSEKNTKLATSTPKTKTTELNFNYIIKTFNARVGAYYLDSNSPGSAVDVTQYGIKLQLQM